LIVCFPLISVNIFEEEQILRFVSGIAVGGSLWRVYLGWGVGISSSAVSVPTLFSPNSLLVSAAGQPLTISFGMPTLQGSSGKRFAINTKTVRSYAAIKFVVYYLCVYIYIYIYIL
jgi:hypothetical protein